jgi:asparagine synthase (glutamine-hydrolysing)
MTREHVTVALSGDGGDENFAGYRRYARALQLHERLDRGLGILARPLFRLAAQLLPVGASGQAYARLLGSGAWERYLGLVACERRDTLRRLLAPELTDLAQAAGDPAHFRRLAEDGAGSDHVSVLAHRPETYLPDDILVKVDRTSMAVSLESRVPLLDHVLMEFLATVPSSLKLRDGTGKYLLKRAMLRSLPARSDAAQDGFWRSPCIMVPA